MRYAGIIKNDICAAPGVCVTFFTQGCPHKCKNCHNPETWNFNGGKLFTEETLKEIYSAISANGINRNFCIMGGEPLCEENQTLVKKIVNSVKYKFPKIKIYIWTGYTLKELKENFDISEIFDKIECLIDGKYVDSLRTINLPMIGSTNQRILYKGKDF